MEKEIALKILRKRHDQALFSERTALETLIPELKESKDDKIRKDLIAFLNDIWHLGKNANFDNWDKADCSDWIAWLEKQGQQKSAWSKEDEVGFGDTLLAIEQARTIAKDKNDMGNLWYAENWLKSLKDRLKGE